MKRGFLSGKLLVPEPTPQPNVSLAAEKVPSVTVSSTASTPVSDSSSATPPNLRKGFLVGKRLEKNVVSRDPKPSTSELQSKSAHPDSPSNPPGYTLFFTENPYTNPALAMMRAVEMPPPYLRRAGEPRSTCLFYMQTKEAILSLESFPLPMYTYRSASPPYQITSDPVSMGLGMYAVRDIEVGEIITSERPLLVIPRFLLPNSIPSPTQLMDIVASHLSVAEKKALFALSNCKPHNDLWGIIDTNGLDVGTYSGFYKGGYVGVCKDTSRINHSCTPNAIYHWDERRFNIFTRALRQIEKGEQIFICYAKDDENRAKRQADLREKYSFTCACTSCSLSPSESDKNDYVRGLLQSVTIKVRENIEVLRTTEDAIDDWLLDSSATWNGYVPMAELAGAQQGVESQEMVESKLRQLIHALKFLFALAEQEHLSYLCFQWVYARLMQAFCQLKEWTEAQFWREKLLEVRVIFDIEK